jgi:hypothetical protein
MPRISAKRLAAYKRRGRKVGRAVGRGVKASALQVATGAVAQLGSVALAGRVGFIQGNWWAAPAMLALAGVLAKRRQRLGGLGDALLGAAGYAGAQQYQLGAAMRAQGAETGALYGSEVGMLYTPGQTMGYLGADENPTSTHYVEPTAAPAEGDVSEAMGLY